MSIYQTWKINPNKKPDLHFNDWTEGFRDPGEILNPKYPNNKGYMMGWYNSKGMTDGYNARPHSFDGSPEFYQSYLSGYQDAEYERSCH